MNKSSLLSVILLSYNSGQKIVDVYKKLSKLFNDENIQFELIIMDDGSIDNSFDIALQLDKEHKEVKAYQLSRNFTSNYSIFAGLEVSNGDCAIMIPDDEQQPYSSIVVMYRLWKNGEKIIIPHRKERNESILKQLFSRLFYKIMNSISEISYPKGGADIAFLDREIIDILITHIHPINTYIIPEVLRLGFNPYYLPYTRPRSNQEKSRWTFKKKMKLAKDIFFSSSTFPIKFITYLGLFFSLTAFVLIIFYSYLKIFGNKEFWGEMLTGWTSLVLFISFFSGLILLSLGVIAHYILLIYDEVKNRPGYIIKKK